jgi:nucleotide-binding universal stress UspA family protein
MLAVKNILVPLDFSEASARVLEFARVLADGCGASLHLLHVIGVPLVTAAITEEERHVASRRLEALLDDTDRDKRHATVSCEVGTPAHEIIEYATRHETDLIVMGTHWHGPTFGMAAGSIAEGVLGLAPCAVLAVKSVEPGPHELTLDPPPATATASK